MEFTPNHQCPQDSPDNSHGYYDNDRNVPLTVPNGTRPNPRGYPVGNSAGGPRSRGSFAREDSNVESGPSRRRIAVACARCRKRKIRCSGDPGNGTGCTNCKSAGVGSTACQFHRVGSDHLGSVLDRINIGNGYTSIGTPCAMMPMYNAGAPLYSRAGHYAYPQLDTKSVYPSAWTVPCSEETSPVETYNLDQPGAYLPNQVAMAAPNTYGSNYRWSQASAKTYPGGGPTYLEHEHVSVYGPHGISYMHNSAPSTASEAFSSLNMSSLQLSLPADSHPQSTHPSDQTASQQRQLPIPMPSPAQTSRNVVDQLQDQRLRSAQAMGRSSRTNSGAFSKLGLPFNSGCEVQIVTTTEENASDLATQVTASAPMPNTTDPAISFLPIATSVSEDAAPGSTQTQLNFSALTLHEGMPASAKPTTYSNFRNYKLPTSSPTETMPNLARHDSQTNLYSFSPESKRHLAGSANDSALVSGHQYTPLNQSQPHHQPGSDDSRRDSFVSRAMPTHQDSVSNANGR